MSRYRVLLVEPNAELLRVFSDYFKRSGLEVVDAVDAGTGLETSRRDCPDMIACEAELPGGAGGLEFTRALRAEPDLKSIPILILSGTIMPEERWEAISSGADDYLVKPFAFVELLARIRAVARRGRVTETGPLAVNTLEIDRATRQVTRAGCPVELTAKEFDLLHYLARYARQVVSRDTLVREVWRETARSTTLDNVIDVHISRLRRKIDSDHPVKLIHTVRGVGFVLREGVQ